MKKILLLSRAFPPRDQAASYRTFSFAKHLHKFGYYPIVVTRNWNIPIHNNEDNFKPSGKEVVHVKENGYEVYYVPFKGDLPNRYPSKMFRKLLVLTDIYLGKRDLFNANYALYKFADDLLGKNKDIRTLLVTAPPFDLFKYGDRLAGKHRIQWVADYRDEWTSAGGIHTDEENMQKRTGLKGYLYDRFLSFKEQRENECKWTRSASFFTTVSTEAVKDISVVTGKEGKLVVNGFDGEHFHAGEKTELYPEFTIAYAGWLYDTQQIEVLTNAVKELADKNKDLKLKLLFIGGKSFPGMEVRLMKLMRGYEKFIELTSRVTKIESIQMQMRSHLLLLCAHKGKTGIPSSKLYEYIGTRKPILLCPSDNGVLESTLKTTGQGHFCHTVEEACSKLNALYQDYLAGKSPALNLDEQAIGNYTREKQVEKLAGYLNELIS